MEGYGFAASCEDRRPSLPWLVVRGISDYGDATKDGAGPTLKDEYHAAAAIAAAAFSREFLVSGYVPLKRLEDPKPHRQMVNRKQSGNPIDIYSSDDDPEFSIELLRAVKKAKSKIVMVGMGLSFLKGNQRAPYGTTCRHLGWREQGWSLAFVGLFV